MLAPIPVTSDGRFQAEPLARDPKEMERSLDVYAWTSVSPSENIPRKNRPASSVRCCSRSIPMPTLTFGLRTQHRSGAPALPEPELKLVQAAAFLAGSARQTAMASSE